MSNWRTSRARPAPTASRTAISCRRAVARASSRLATLAHAISSTSPTTPISTLPASTSCCWNCGGKVPSVIGRTASERPRKSVGKASSSPLPMAFTLACACSKLTPGFSRPTASKIRPGAR